MGKVFVAISFCVLLHHLKDLENPHFISKISSMNHIRFCPFRERRTQ